MLSNQARDMNMEAETPQRPRKRLSDATQLERNTPAALTPAPVNDSNRLIEKPLLKKRYRRKLDDSEKKEVAAVRKRGACDECRRKKEKCRHPKKQDAIDEPGTDIAAPELQRSESQDSWFSVTSSVYSETSNLGGDHFAATSVSAGLSASVDQLSSSHFEWLNSVGDSDNCHQEYGTSSTQVYSTSHANSLAPRGLHLSLDQMSQGAIVSQNNSHLSTRGNEELSISPSTAPSFPRRNEFWQQITQSDGGNGQSPDLVSLPSRTLPSGGLQQMAGLPGACLTHNGFMQQPRSLHCHGCCACNAMVLEVAPTGPQPGMSALIRRSPHFDSPNSSGIRVQTVPDHFFSNHIPPNEMVSQSPGSSVDMRIASFIPDNTRHLSLGSHPLSFQTQDSFKQMPLNPMVFDFPRLSYGSQVAFGTNTVPQYGRDTFQGYEMPSCSSHVPAMMNGPQEPIFDQTTQFPNAFAPGTSEFPQTSTDGRYSPRPTIAEQELPHLRKSPSLNSQPNPTSTNFPQSPP